MLNLIYIEIENNKISTLKHGAAIKHHVVEDGDLLTYSDFFYESHPISLLNAILIKKEEDEIRIYVDHYSSIPLFYTITENKILLSNIFNAVSKNVHTNDIDEIGFWESFLFESPLLDRTLLKDIKIIQAGHYLSIKKKSVVQIQYFTFSYHERDTKNIIEDCYESLNKIDLNLDSKQILFPISGGVDSRLLLGLFKKKSNAQSIIPITYSYNKSSLEFIYAKKLLKKTNIDYQEHDFHKLDHNSYLKHNAYLLNITGGLIGAQNSHLLGYLLEKRFDKGSVLISGLFADTIFGYASKTSYDNNILNNKYYKTAQIFFQKKLISEEIFESIKEDLIELHIQWEKGSNLKSFAEFMYIKERTSKFHMQLYNLYRTILDVKLPLLHNDVILSFMGIPTEIKENKAIIFHILDKYFPEYKNINNISSSGRFGSGRGKGMTKLNFYSYILLTIVNKIILNKLRIPFAFDNPYDTEKQDFYFYRYNRKRWHIDLNYLQKLGLIDKNKSKQLSKRIDGMRNFQLVSNIELLRKIIN